ncbi:MAG: hypothetical protein AABX28_00610 [Nanoarchaeota archaeon]
MAENQITLDMKCFGTDGTSDDWGDRIKILSAPIEIKVQVQKNSENFIKCTSIKL